jgi:tRNA(fMet)-specific endonuclease VapC
MNYFLDTNICIYFLNGKYPSVVAAMRRVRPSQIKISSLVKAELLYGAEKSEQRKRNMQKLECFLLPFEVVSFDDSCAVVHGALRSRLEQKGIGVGAHDTLIAATVIAAKGTLITHNVREFSRIKGLKIADWVRG